MTRGEIVALNREGVRHQGAGDLDAALRAFAGAADGLRALRDPVDERDTLAFCDLLSNAAAAATALGVHDVACAALSEADDALRALPPAASAAPRVLRQVECLCGLASAFRAMGAGAKAARSLKAADALLDPHTCVLDAPTRDRWRAKARNILGGSVLRAGRAGEARALFGEALALTRPHVGSGADLRSEAAHAALNRGVACNVEHQWREAERCLRIARWLFRPLAEAQPHLYGRSLLGVHAQLAFAYQNAGSPARLRETLLSARSLQRRIGLDAPAHADFEGALAAATLDYTAGMAAERVGDWLGAEPLFRSGVACLSPFPGVSPEGEVIYAYCAERLAHLAIERRRDGEVAYWARKAVARLAPDAAPFAGIAPAAPIGIPEGTTPEVGRLLILLGAALMSASQWEGAHDALTAGIETLARFAMTDAYHDDTVAALINRSVVCGILGRPEAALEDACRAAAFLNPASGQYAALRADALLARAVAELGLGRLSDAEANALAGIAVVRDSAPGDGYRGVRARVWGASILLEARLQEAVA
jgi:tetratricopeptide (TPR) repeat protein